MNKIVICIIAIALLISMTACQGGNTSPDRDEKQKGQESVGANTPAVDDHYSESTTEVKHSGRKVNGEITACSEFSEGMAFVCLDGNKEKTYCINKEGYIVFELDKKLAVNGYISERFANGLVMIDGGMCDATGSITYPEDVGASKFYDIALEGGYIIAEKVTADNSSAKVELGVMDMSFRWILEPSQDVYRAVEDSLFFSAAANTKSYYCDDIVFYSENDNYLNLKTGEVLSEAPFATPSYAWDNGSYNHSNFLFYDENDNIVLDLSDLQNLYIMRDFTNGKAPIIFKNNEANTYFFTLIDEKGVFAFEPISCGRDQISNIYYDGQDTILIEMSDNAKDYAAMCYNVKGELLGKLPVSEVSNESGWFSLSNGVVIFSGNKTCRYFSPDFEPLF